MVFTTERIDNCRTFVLQQGMSLFIIWAYHATNDVQPSQFPSHSSGNGARGFMSLILIPAAITPTMTLPSPTPGKIARPDG